MVLRDYGLDTESWEQFDVWGLQAKEKFSE